MDLGQVKEDVSRAVMEILEAGKAEIGDLFVVGCSTSEVLGERIGTHTNMDVAYAIYEGVAPILMERGIYLAGQCCEHLNRALVVEKEAALAFHLERVNAIPRPNHAGGAFATACYERMKEPYLVESLLAQARVGMDIGGTMIGMHLHPVVVPLRISLRQIGLAPLSCARVRPKYVGGSRAVYDENLY